MWTLIYGFYLILLFSTNLTYDIMRHQEINFQSFYQTRLQEQLRKLGKKKTPALLATAYMRFAIMTFFVVFFSIFLGFLSIFPMDNAFIWIVKGFMITVAFIVIYGNIRKYVLHDLKQFFPTLAESRSTINVITIGSIILIMLAATYLGFNYLGGGFDNDFFLRYGGAIIGMVILVLPILFLKHIAEGFALNYKKVLIPELIDYMGVEATYTGDKYVAKADFLDSGLFTPESINKYVGFDLTEGKDGETNFSFSQLEVQEFRRGKGKNSKSEIVEIFKGLFYVSDFNKKMEGHTLVVPDVATELFGRNLGERINKLGSYVYEDVKLEQLENAEFEDYFSVFSSDPVEARYVLSPKLVESIMILRKELDRDYSLSFKNGKMYIAIESGKDFFGPNLFSSLDNQVRAEEIYHLLTKVVRITQQFDLNTRVWG